MEGSVYVAKVKFSKSDIFTRAEPGFFCKFPQIFASTPGCFRLLSAFFCSPEFCPPQALKVNRKRTKSAFTERPIGKKKRNRGASDTIFSA